VSFVRRKIDLKFQLGTGSFGDSGMNAVDVTGLRVHATISKAGGLGMATANVDVYGLDPKVANQISTLGKVLTAGRNNTITISAGDDEAGMAICYIGTIDMAWSDYTNAPDAKVQISAHQGLLENLKPIAPTSFKGSADVATILQTLAGQMGYTFENNGVSVQLSNQYLSGTAREQAYTVAANAGINIVMDDQPGGVNTLAIWPKDGQRQGNPPAIGPDTGLVSYPTWIENGIVLKSIFNPKIIVGGTVAITSSVPNANGTWQVFNLLHDIESEDPEGPWYSTVSCNVLGHQTPLAGGQ
jgi:hypothetical protein